MSTIPQKQNNNFEKFEIQNIQPGIELLEEMNQKLK